MIIDIDTEKIKFPISAREKIAVYVLLLIFNLIAPAQYKHQVDNVCKELKEMLSEK